MVNVAFIPVRGGSKSIPLKNIKNIAGQPLVYWTVKAACDCKDIDKVYVATDSQIIKSTVEGFGLNKVRVVGRSAESSTDTASTEMVMLEFAAQYDFDNIALVQATSPLLTGEDLERGFKLFSIPDTDSILSVVRQKRFHWALKEDGVAYPSNYDVFHRPRRQEFEGYLVENGAFYITSRLQLLESKNRVSGKIRVCEMDESTYFEIDEPSDWIIIEEQLKKRLGITLSGSIPQIKMFLTDCDGCLTDGGMYYGESGEEMKRFNTKDGVAFRLLKEKGIITGMVTGEQVELNQRRCNKMKLDIYKSGVNDKATIIRQLSEQYNISLKNIAYVGDDINDLEALKIVGFSCAPADAIQDVRNIVDYVAYSRGGAGVIREIAEKVLRDATK